MIVYYSYKDGSVELADTARGLASAYANIGDEDAESKSYLLAKNHLTYAPIKRNPWPSHITLRILTGVHLTIHCTGDSDNSSFFQNHFGITNGEI